MIQKNLGDIEKEFRSAIFVPAESNRSSQIFFCPVGLVGAGKTTVTKPIAQQLHLVRLSGDELRKLLKENGYTYEPLKEILFRVGNQFIEKGYSVAFDMDC